MAKPERVLTDDLWHQRLKPLERLEGPWCPTGRHAPQWLSMECVAQGVWLAFYMVEKVKELAT